MVETKKVDPFNTIFDYVVIGGSSDGIHVVNELANKNKKVVIVDNNKLLNSVKNPINENVFKIYDRAVYSSFYKGLIHINLASGKSLFCCKLILALGITKSSTLPIKSFKGNLSGIYFSATDVTDSCTNTEEKEVVIFGGIKDCLRASTSLLGKFKKITTCYSEFDSIDGLRGSKKLTEASHSGLAEIIPGCTFDSVTLQANDKICIKLNTEETIFCDYLVDLTPVNKPYAIPMNVAMCSVTEDGYINTDSFGAVPVMGNNTIFAVGECTKNKINCKKVLTILK